VVIVVVVVLAVIVVIVVVSIVAYITRHETQSIAIKSMSKLNQIIYT
jgi:hypothetical protein